MSNDAPMREVLIAMAAEMGAGDAEMRDVAEALTTGDYRPWLVRQGLLDGHVAAKLSDGAIGFFAAGVMAERMRRMRSS